MVGRWRSWLPRPGLRGAVDWNRAEPLKGGVDLIQVPPRLSGQIGTCPGVSSLANRVLGQQRP